MNPSGSLSTVAVCRSCRVTDPPMSFSWSLFLLSENSGLYDQVRNLSDMVLTGRVVSKGIYYLSFYLCLVCKCSFAFYYSFILPLMYDSNTLLTLINFILIFLTTFPYITLRPFPYGRLSSTFSAILLTLLIAPSSYTTHNILSFHVLLHDFFALNIA